MEGTIAPFLVTAGAAATAIASLLWALRVTDGARGAIRKWQDRNAELELKLARADSVFGAHPGVVIIWEEPAQASESDWGAPRAYGSPLALASLLRFSHGGGAGEPALRILQGLAAFEAKDASGQAARLSTSLAKLRREGAPFSLTISTPTGVHVEVDGRTAGPRAVLWIVDSSIKGVEESGAQGRLESDPNLVIARDPATFLEVLHQAPFPAWRVSENGKLDWANKAYLEAVEARSLEQAIARNIALDQAATEQARKVVETGEGSIETRHVAVKGDRRAWRIVMNPVGGGAAACMAFDVTETEELRENFHRHVAAHDETLNHLGEGVAVFGADKRLIFHNRAFADMWSMEPGFLADRPSHAQWLDQLKSAGMLPAHHNYPEWRAGELALYQGAGDLPEEPWNLKDGRTLRVARQRHPMGGLLLVFSDMTSELKLRAQYNALLRVQQAALDKLHEAVAVFGSDGRLQLFNAAFLATWKLQPESLAVGLDFERVVDGCTPLYHNASVWSKVKARIADPSPDARREERGEMRRSDGTVVTYLTRPLPDGATLLAFLDVTAERRVEGALRERAEALEAADRLKTDFVQNVSVQLRDPLQTISGYSQVLATRIAGPLNDRQQDQVEMIVSASNHLSKLIDNVLDLAMIEAGELDLELTEFALLPLLQEAAGSATNVRDTEIPIRVLCNEKVGIVRADEKRVRQILFNLVSNAHRFTERGDTITIGAERADGMIRIWVADTGKGMPFEEQAAAFDNFASGDRRGAGLGLALVRSFAELHGGWVSLRSEPGEGTEVSVQLPVSGAVSMAAE